VTALAVANAAAVMLSGWTLASSCTPRWPTGSVPLDNFLVTFCPNLVLISGLAAICAAAVTLWLCSNEMSRGIADVGFVGTSLRAERNRRHGL
jgi:rhomboid protease GluP